MSSSGESVYGQTPMDARVTVPEDIVAVVKAVTSLATGSGSAK